MQTLIILVKNPVAGKTKTRLAASVGHPKALRMYHQLMAYTESQATALTDKKRLLLYSEQIVKDDQWPEAHYQKDIQKGPGLGERMSNAFEAAFAAGAERAVIIGSDCPGVTTQLLEDAFSALDKHDLVIGPAVDGGYYLLGMKQAAPALFQNIAWSTEAVASQTLAVAESLHLKVATLTALRDVDHLEDWLSYGWEVPK
jgi:hypothetical protein